MKKVVFTIVAKNYIGLAQILEESFKLHNADIDFFIIVADEFTVKNSVNTLPSNVLIARNILDITPERWVDMSFKYDLTEFCTSIKPSSFLYFLNIKKYDQIIYLDPDIYIFNSLDPIFSMLDMHSIVLTPHIVDIQDTFTGDISEDGFMSNGIFNLGFCGIKRSQAAFKMLAWWRGKLFDKCYIDSFDTYFTDQKWMDFLPGFFNQDELLISNHLGMNIAPWNFFERKVVLDKGQFFVLKRQQDNNEVFYPVLFVHYSGFNYQELKKGNVLHKSDSLNDYVDIKLLTSEYAEAIYSKREIFEKYIDEKYSYGSFENGDVIISFHRRIYRSLVNKGENFDNPFNVGKNSLFERFKKLGMLNNFSFNLDKANKNELKGIKTKLKIFNNLTRFGFRLIGFEKYVLLIRLFRAYSRYEAQIHLFDSKYNDDNIKF